MGVAPGQLAGGRPAGYLQARRSDGVELGATEKQLQLAVRAGLESGNFGFPVRHANHSARLPPRSP